MDDYPLLHLLWSMLMILGFVIWFWLLITVFSDLFRRHDISGGKKALWLIFMIITGPIGILIYLILNGHSMAERQNAAITAAQKDFDNHVKSVAGGATGQIEQAKKLLDSGAITQEEFDALKAKALA